MKKSAKCLLIIVPWLVMFFFGLVYLWGQIFVFPWVWVEKERVTDPSNVCELVTYEGNRGAMSSFAYACFLVKVGAKADPNKCGVYEPILSSTHVSPKVHWERANQLMINPNGGYVTHARPYSREFGVSIEIENSLPKKD